MQSPKETNTKKKRKKEKRKDHPEIVCVCPWRVGGGCEGVGDGHRSGKNSKIAVRIVVRIAHNKMFLHCCRRRG